MRLSAPKMQNALLLLFILTYIKPEWPCFM